MNRLPPTPTRRPQLKKQVLEFLIQTSEQKMLRARRELMRERQFLRMACSADADRSRQGWEGLERCARAHLTMRTEAAELRRLRRLRGQRPRALRPASDRLYAYGETRRHV